MRGHCARAAAAVARVAARVPADAAGDGREPCLWAAFGAAMSSPGGYAKLSALDEDETDEGESEPGPNRASLLANLLASARLSFCAIRKMLGTGSPRRGIVANA